MPLLPDEQAEIERQISHILRDVTRANPFRLKAAIRILMTTSFAVFQNVCSKAVQKELLDLTKILLKPDDLAPQSIHSDNDREHIREFIKKYTLNNLHLLDNRTSILPNTVMIRKSIMEGERLKSVVHTSAMRNVVTNAHYVDTLEKKFQEEGMPPEKIATHIERVLQSIQELHRGVLEGNISKVLMSLATHGVDVNYPNEQGMTPLHIAVREGLVETVKLLLTVPNIRVDHASSNGWTPLHMAARIGNADIVDALLTIPDINPNAVNSDGWTALQWAAWHGFADVITVLLTAPGININQADRFQTTPLHWAARNGHPDIITILLSIPNIIVNPVDNDKRTPLHLAVTYNHEDAVRTLLATPQIDVNCIDMDGLTPLHYAARNGHLNILKALLAHPDTLIDILDNNRMIPLEWALRNDHTLTIKILKSYQTHQGKELSLFNKFLNVFRKNQYSNHPFQ